MNYTKGKWKLDNLNSFRAILYPEGKDNSYIIAEINTGRSSYTKITPQEGEDNACLLLASKDMYELLKALYAERINIGLDKAFWTTGNTEAIERMLAKAEGR